MPQLATRDELIAYLNLGGDDPARIRAPERLDMMIESAEKTVAMLANRQFYPEPEFDADGLDTNPAVTKTFRIRRKSYDPNQVVTTRVRVPDLREAEVVALDGVALVRGLDWDYETYEGDEPFTSVVLYQATIYASPFAVSLTAELSITGRWGFPEVPADVKDAVLQIASRRWHRQAAMYADQVDTGTGVFDFRGGVHPDIQGTLRRYRPLQVSLV